MSKMKETPIEMFNTRKGTLENGMLNHSGSMEHKHRHSRKPWSKFINTDNQHLVPPEVVSLKFKPYRRLVSWDKVLRYDHLYSITFNFKGHAYLAQVREAETSRMRNRNGPFQWKPISRTIINKIRGDARGNRVRFPRELRAKEHLPRGGRDTPHVRKNQN
ncbi:hypothetical protein YC2023_113920 [Brassica napus]